MKEAGIITAMVSLLKVLDGWEFGAILLVLMVVPVLVTLLITRSNRELREKIQEDQVASEKRFEALREESEKRFESVVQMYENNVELVQNYEKVAGDLTTVVHLSTQAMTKLVDRVDLSLKMLEEKDMSLKLLQSNNNNGK